jgi:hypothetical protein
VNKKLVTKNERGEIIEEPSPDPFKTARGVYVFPFVPVDPTPGGRNLGRIEWAVEYVVDRRKRNFSALLISVCQTRDPRYRGKVYRIPGPMTEFINSPSAGGGRDAAPFTSLVWRTLVCPVHKALALYAYPKDEHRFLVVEPWSQIGGVHFSRELPT